MSSLPPKGTPPPSALVRQEKLKALVDLEDGELEDNYRLPANEVEAPVVKSRTNKIEKSVTKAFYTESDAVELDNEILTVKFYVKDFADTELALIFIIEPEQFNVIPKTNTSFDLTYKNNKWPVLFVGKPFYLQKLGVHQIIFIKNLEKLAND